jgi:hypothetical protein
MQDAEQSLTVTEYDGIHDYYCDMILTDYACHWCTGIQSVLCWSMSPVR